jgi:hypothetical protein
MPPASPPRTLTTIGDNDADMTIFQQPWWLEAVSDNRYRAISAGGDSAFIWWPFMQERWWGFSLIGAPPMTHILGPVIRLPDSKEVSRASQRDKLITAALAQFPHSDGFQQVLAPDGADALDFQLAGFEIAVRYTYRLGTQVPVEALWAGLKDSARNKVRRARHNFTLSGDMSMMQFYAFYESNLHALGRINHHDEGVYRRLGEALEKRDRHRIISAVDNATGKVAAAVLLVWDKGSLYHFRATLDRKVDKPGASSLLVWESIQLAAQLGVAFDSDTFYGRGGATFMEAFGVRPAQRLVISRKTIALKAAEAIKRRFSPQPRWAIQPEETPGKSQADQTPAAEPATNAAAAETA